MEQGRDENTRRLFCYTEVTVKEDWKTTLPLLHSQATEVEVVFQSYFTTIFL